MKSIEILRTASVNIASLKAQLAKYLRIVKGGEEVVVLEHKMPIARIIPYETETPLETIKPLGSFIDWVAKTKIPLLKKQKFDSLTLLLEERRQR